MSTVYIPYIVQAWKDDVCLFEADCELKIDWNLPDGRRGPVDWDVTGFYFSDKRADGKLVYTEIGRTEPLFGVLYKDLDTEWIDERLREVLADHGAVDLYA